MTASNKALKAWEAAFDRADGVRKTLQENGLNMPSPEDMRADAHPDEAAAQHEASVDAERVATESRMRQNPKPLCHACKQPLIWVDCARCDGTGWVEDDDWQNFEGDQTPCPDCMGQGEVTDCDNCRYNEQP